MRRIYVILAPKPFYAGNHLYFPTNAQILEALTSRLFTP